MQARQLTTASNASLTLPLAMVDGSAGAYTVATNNATVATATVSGGTLKIQTLAPGRAGLRITNTAVTPNETRYLGVRVENADGTLPGLPNYLALGSVSQDTTDDLDDVARVRRRRVEPPDGRALHLPQRRPVRRRPTPVGAATRTTGTAKPSRSVSA